MHTKGKGNIITIVPRGTMADSAPKAPEKPSAKQAKQEHAIYPIRALFKENAQLRAENMHLRDELAKMRLALGSED